MQHTTRIGSDRREILISITDNVCFFVSLNEKK